MQGALGNIPVAVHIGLTQVQTRVGEYVVDDAGFVQAPGNTGFVAATLFLAEGNSPAIVVDDGEFSELHQTLKQLVPVHIPLRTRGVFATFCGIRSHKLS